MKILECALAKIASRLVLRAVWLALLAGISATAHSAVGPWIRIDNPTNGANFSAPASVLISVSAGSTSSGISVGPVRVSVDGTPTPNGTTLSGLPAGTYEIYAFANVYSGGQMLIDPVEVTGSFTITQPVQNAQFVGQSVPSTMVVGQAYSVSVQMKNLGSATWDAAAAYRLGSQNPHDNVTWGTGRINVPAPTAMGQTATFNFTAIAPTAAGTYNFQWKMVQDGAAWFGDATANQPVTVLASTITGSIESVGGNMLAGWACSTRLNQSIAVHLYVGGPAGTGVGVGAYTANLGSEPAVASACQASGTAYRFNIPITQQMITQHGGKPIYVHGISPVGASNLTIAGSGALYIPANQPPVVAMTAPASGASMNLPVAFTLQASATDADDQVAKVTFYANGQPLYTDTSAPYQHPMVTVPEGNNSYHAVAEDTRGAITTSATTTVKMIRVNGSQPLIPPQPGTTRFYVYDQHQRLCKTIEPETGATVMDYDAAGNLQWTAAGLDLPSTTSCDTIAGRDSGRKVTRLYDARNRLHQLLFPDGRGDQLWAYTPDGLPSQITTWNDPSSGAPVVNAYTYNRRRLLTGESVGQPGWYAWGIGYGYDANGSLASQTYPTGLIITYAPNALGQPTQVRDQTSYAYASGVSYYPNGAVQQFTYGNGIVHSMGQNARQLPMRSIDSGGVLDHEYTYDQNANVTSILDHGRGQHYSRWMAYDGANRLTDAGSCSFGGDCWHRFRYNHLDNLTSWTLAGVKDYSRYYYDPVKNRLQNIQNSSGATIVGLEYDPQGNLNNRNGQAYSFDYGNRLRGTTNQEWYRYDGHGRRVLNWRWTESGVLSQYSQSGQLLYDENYRASGRKANEYVYFGGSLVATRERNIDTNASVIKFQHTDALGSPVAVTNQAGQVIERNDYEPYGAVIGKPNYDGIGYTGHVQDAATGLTYMQQRYYDSQIGRFLSIDPMPADGGAGGNFNRYKYAANNPYSYKDPDGRQECRSCEISYGASVGSMLRDDPEKLRVWEGGERAARNIGSGSRDGAAVGQAIGKFVDAGDYSKEGVAALAVQMTVVALTHGRGGKQFRGPDPDARGPHTRFRADENGNVTHYETYDYPAPGQGKRVDIVGAEHGGIPTPHVVETTRHVNPHDPSKSRYTESKTRPASIDEVPRGR
jgi:RHS repeat-associated protein